jgi:hypothetical protein
VLSRLTAEPESAGAPVLADDGTYPKTPLRQEALNSAGLVLIVWQTESEGRLDNTPGGAAVEEIGIAVVIEENAAVCRAAGGLALPAGMALRLVRKAVLGKRHTSSP